MVRWAGEDILLLPLATEVPIRPIMVLGIWGRVPALDLLGWVRCLDMVWRMIWGTTVRMIGMVLANPVEGMLPRGKAKVSGLEKQEEVI